MPRPEFTETQILEVKNKFQELMSQTPKSTYDLWKKEGSIDIINNTVIILPNGIEGKLHGKLADDFVILLNKHGLLI